MQLNWLKIDVKTDEKLDLPFFTGSMIRGVIGYALKEVTCINPSYRCVGCHGASECLYYQFYEEHNLFHSYRLGITLKPQKLDFSFYLFEDAIASLSTVLTTLKLAMENEGVGTNRIKVKVKSMLVSEMVVYENSRFLPLEKIQPNRVQLDTYCPNIVLEFITPLRIKENNKLAYRSVALHTLIGNIQNRYRQLRGEKPQGLGYKVEGEIVDSTLKYVKINRYSNRKETKMSIGGLKGKLIISGLDRKSYDFLKIGEIIGSGKQTVFGLGTYILKEMR